MDELALSESKHTSHPFSDEDANDVHTRFKYWVDGPIGFTLAIIGLAVNFIAIVILAKQRVQRTFHLLMIFLSFWDFSYLILSILCFALPLLSIHYRDNVSIYLIPYVIPSAQLCLFGSCYSTIALTVERYIAVCFPFFRLRHNLKARYYIVPILLFAPLYNLPRFFEFETVKEVRFACLDDQLEALNLNRSLPQVDIHNNYNDSNVPQKLIENMHFNATTIPKRNVNETNIYDNNLNEEMSLYDNLTSSNKFNGITSTLVSSSMVLTEANHALRIKRSIAKEHINDMISIIVENHHQELKLISETELLSNHSLNELRRHCQHWHKVTHLRLDVTDLRKNTYYIQIYINYVNLIVNLFIPTIVLGVLNCLVYQALKKSTSLSTQLRRSGRGEEAMRKRDIRLTRIAIVIVGVFLACHLPRFIPNIVEMLFGLPEWFAIMISVNGLLQITNCTVNYIIYFGHCWKQKRSEDGDRQAGVTYATTACGESGYEMDEKSSANGTARKPFLKSATVDYTPGSVSIPLSVVTETTRLNPPRNLHAENSHL